MKSTAYDESPKKLKSVVAFCEPRSPKGSLTAEPRIAAMTLRLILSTFELKRLTSARDQKMRPRLRWCSPYGTIFWRCNLDHIAMKVLEVDFRPFSDSIQDGPQGGATFCYLIGIIACGSLRVCSFYQFQVGQQTQPRREDVCWNVLWRGKKCHWPP